MGVRRNFRKEATSEFCLSFLGYWQCSANGPWQSVLPLLHQKENAPFYDTSPTNAVRWQH